MGRRRRQATDDQGQAVKALAGYGLSPKEIAKVIGLDSVESLRKYFHEELTLGRLEAHSNVLSTLFRMAVAGNPAAIMFWLKTRARWSERGPRKETEPVSHTIWEIQEYAPPLSPEQQKLLDEALRRFDVPVSSRSAGKEIKATTKMKTTRCPAGVGCRRPLSNSQDGHLRMSILPCSREAQADQHRALEPKQEVTQEARCVT